jgi:hypothetical protein
VDARLVRVFGGVPRKEGRGLGILAERMETDRKNDEGKGRNLRYE